jgi:hypothetical protein
MQERKSGPTGPNELSAPELGLTAPVVATSTTFAPRRRLLRGGLAAVPVLMTVASRPAMGQTVCITASDKMSVLSSHTALTYTCSGGDCKFWAQRLSGQTSTSTSGSGYYMEAKSDGPAPSSTDTAPLTSDTSDQFGVVFGNGTYSSMTFLQVLQAGKDDSAGTAGLAAHLVAAVLNARAGMTPKEVLGEGLAVEIWRSFSVRPYFEPTAGVPWSIAQTIDWLKTTMPQRG